MKIALLAMLVLGAAIGLLLPGGERAGPVVAAAVAAGDPRPTVLERSAMGHFYANAEVKGALVRFLVDTGATSVVLSEKDALRLGIPFSRNDSVVVGDHYPNRSRILQLSHQLAHREERVPRSRRPETHCCTSCRRMVVVARHRACVTSLLAPTVRAPSVDVKSRHCAGV